MVISSIMSQAGSPLYSCQMGSDCWQRTRRRIYRTRGASAGWNSPCRPAKVRRIISRRLSLASLTMGRTASRGCQGEYRMPSDDHCTDTDCGRTTQSPGLWQKPAEMQSRVVGARRVMLKSMLSRPEKPDQLSP